MVKELSTSDVRCVIYVITYRNFWIFYIRHYVFSKIIKFYIESLFSYHCLRRLKYVKQIIRKLFKIPKYRFYICKSYKKWLIFTDKKKLSNQ